MFKSKAAVAAAAPTAQAPMPMPGPVQAFLKSVGIDPVAMYAEFLSGKEWIVRALTHYKLRFDTIEALNRQAIEDAKGWNQHLEELETKLISTTEQMRLAIEELRDTLKRKEGTPPDQTWDEESLDLATRPIAAELVKEDADA